MNLISLQFNRSSHTEVFRKKDVLKNLAEFTRKQLCQRLFLKVLHGQDPQLLFKKGLRKSCFHMNFADFLAQVLLQNTASD